LETGSTVLKLNPDPERLSSIGDSGVARAAVSMALWRRRVVALGKYI